MAPGYRYLLLQNRENHIKSWLFTLIPHSYQCRTLTTSTNSDKVDNKRISPTTNRINHWLNVYEDIVGLKDVRDAQGKVIEAERNFMEIQAERRRQQDQLLSVQTKLRAVSAEREKTNRVHDNYLELVTSEHTILREENDIIMTISITENTEREYFQQLSAALRESHEKERSRTERTKYWSIIGSLMGVTLGVVGSMVNKHFQMKELRNMISAANDNSEKYLTVSDSILDAVTDQSRLIEDIVEKVQSGVVSDNAGGKHVGADNTTIDAVYSHKLTEILSEIKRNNELVESQLIDVRKLIEGKIESPDIPQRNEAMFRPRDEKLLKSTEKIEQKIVKDDAEQHLVPDSSEPEQIGVPKSQSKITPEPEVLDLNKTTTEQERVDLNKIRTEQEVLDLNKSTEKNIRTEKRGEYMPQNQMVKWAKASAWVVVIGAAWLLLNN